MKKILFLCIVVTLGYVGLKQYGEISMTDTPVAGAESSKPAASARVFETRSSNNQLQGQGIVIKVLPDDQEGSRHQRFILKLPSGQTLLIAHNIDLAPRISSLRVGDSVAFNGEYKPNAKGGVVHWTHHDPAGRHAAGWLKHGGQTYQ